MSPVVKRMISSGSEQLIGQELHQKEVWSWKTLKPINQKGHWLCTATCWTTLWVTDLKLVNFMQPQIFWHFSKVLTIMFSWKFQRKLNSRQRCKLEGTSVIFHRKLRSLQVLSWPAKPAIIAGFERPSKPCLLVRVKSNLSSGYIIFTTLENEARITKCIIYAQNILVMP